MFTEHKAEWRNYSDIMWNWYDEFPDEWTAWRTVTPGTSEKAIKLRLKEDKIIMTDELKPCPFCGGEAKLMKMDYEGGEVWGVFCKDDLAAEYSHGHYIDNYMTAESAIAAWNRRAAMIATDELRLPNDTNELDMLLNERGQEHRVWPSGRVVWHDECTVYEYEPAKNHHDEYWGGILRMTMRHLTPAQAIDATLGRGTCYDVGNGTRFVCSECGCSLDLSDLDGEPTMWVKDMADTPKYCPNCGRKVVW